MRVTNLSIGAQVLRELQRGLGAMARRQDQLASGRRLLTPSDDPAASARVIVTRDRRAAVEQWARNIAEARDRLGSADQTIQSLADAVTRARELAVQGNNATLDGVARAALAREIDQILEGAVALANEQRPRGDFLFGGQESTRPPYVAARDAAGRITAVTPNPRGIDAERTAEVDDDLLVSTGVAGTEVFGAPADTSYAFAVLIRLRDSLDADEAGVVQTLGLTADVDGTGAAAAGAYLGVDAAGDLEIAGPAGTAFVRLTIPADDPVSTTAPATSAIATAAAINDATAITGVTAVATPAVFTVPSAAGLFDDIALAAGDLVLNGVDVVVNLTTGNAAANRDTFVAAVNALSGQTGVIAAAGAGLGMTLTASDGRNIAVQTAAGSGPGSVAGEILGFAAPPTSATVVARGSVRLSAGELFTTTEFNTTGQVSGEGRAGGIGGALADLADVQDRLLEPQALVGARLSWLDLLEERGAAESVDLAATLSRLEDLDVPRAVQEFEQTKLAYEAALASSASLLRLSLLDFLR
jgi:flagellin-like hook-associated protein FlgL